MIDLQNKQYCPVIEEIGACIGNPVFDDFCKDMKQKYKCSEKIEFSACSLAPGWNIKFKKSGKTLCTIYPGEAFFTTMVVVGKKEKERVEEILPECDIRLQEIYHRTKEGNGARWLMIDLEDKDSMYDDVFRLIAIRKG